jgi:ATP-dependent Clp endopeptidase proteolytic subunit ClpP
MPCIECEEGKYKFGENGECQYSSLEACEEANTEYQNKTYNDYPQSATNNAKKALKYKEENGSDCGTNVGWKRANQLAKREKISRDTIARMASFKRHQQHKDVPYTEGCGGLMWDAWGGTSGVNWAINKLEEIDNYHHEKKKYKKKNDVHYDHHFDFSEEQMAELHEKGRLEVTVSEGEKQMVILFTYKDGKIEEHGDIKNLVDMNWYNIKNLSDASTEVVIYDEIGTWGVDSKSFIEEVKGISTENVLLRINSPGGSVIDGLAIHDAIKRMPQKVTAQIEGLAASIASVIALGADEVTMSENSLFMIHNVWGGETGGAKEMRKAADLMDKMGDRLVNIYVSKTGKEESEIRNWMNEETWFTAEEAFEAGFINRIEEPIALAAKFDVNKLNYKNKSLVVEMFNNSNNQKSNKMEKQFDDLKNFISDLFSAKKENNVEEVKVLDNEEVVAKMKDLEDAINASTETINELSTTLEEKESNIVALADEVSVLEDKVAKYEGQPSDIVPEKDPNPTPENVSEDVWDSFANNISNDKKVYFKN